MPDAIRDIKLKLSFSNAKANTSMRKSIQYLSELEQNLKAAKKEAKKFKHEITDTDFSALKKGLRGTGTAVKAEMKKMQGYARKGSKDVGKAIEDRFEDTQGRVNEIMHMMTWSVYRSVLKVGKMMMRSISEWVGEFDVLVAKVVDVTNLLPESMRTEYQEKFLTGLRNISVELGITETGNLAEGLYNLQSASGDAENAMSSLAVMAKTAKAGVSDVNSVVDFGTSVTNAYGRSYKDIKAVMDVAMKTVEYGKVRLKDLNATGKLLAASNQAGLGFPELMAIMGQATKDGMKLRQSISGLEGIMKRMTEVKGIKMFKQWGIDVVDSQGKIKDFAGTFQSLAKLITEGKITQIDIGKIFTRKRAKNLAQLIIGAFNKAGEGGKSAMETALSKISWKGAAGTMESAFNEIEKTQLHKTKILKAQWNEFTMSLGQYFSKAIEPIKKIISGFFDWLNKNPWMRNLIAGIMGIVTVLGALGVAFMAVSVIIKGEMLKTFILFMKHPIVLAIVAITVAIIALKAAIDSANYSLEDFNNDLGYVSKKRAAIKSTEELIKKYDELGSSIDSVRKKQKELENTKNRTAVQDKELEDITAELSGELSQQDRIIDSLRKKYPELAAEMEATGKEGRGLKIKLVKGKIKEEIEEAKAVHLGMMENAATDLVHNYENTLKEASDKAFGSAVSFNVKFVELLKTGKLTTKELRDSFGFSPMNARKAIGVFKTEIDKAMKKDELGAKIKKYMENFETLDEFLLKSEGIAWYQNVTSNINETFDTTGQSLFSLMGNLINYSGALRGMGVSQDVAFTKMFDNIIKGGNLNDEFVSSYLAANDTMRESMEQGAKAYITSQIQQGKLTKGAEVLAEIIGVDLAEAYLANSDAVLKNLGANKEAIIKTLEMKIAQLDAELKAIESGTWQEMKFREMSAKYSFKIFGREVRAKYDSEMAMVEIVRDAEETKEKIREGDLKSQTKEAKKAMQTAVTNAEMIHKEIDEIKNEDMAKEKQRITKLRQMYSDQLAAVKKQQISLAKTTGKAVDVGTDKASKKRIASQKKSNDKAEKQRLKSISKVQKAEDKAHQKALKRAEDLKNRVEALTEVRLKAAEDLAVEEGKTSKIQLQLDRIRRAAEKKVSKKGITSKETELIMATALDQQTLILARELKGIRKDLNSLDKTMDKWAGKFELPEIVEFKTFLRTYLISYQKLLTVSNEGIKKNLQLNMEWKTTKFHIEKEKIEKPERAEFKAFSQDIYGLPKTETLMGGKLDETKLYEESQKMANKYIRSHIDMAYKIRHNVLKDIYNVKRTAKAKLNLKQIVSSAEEIQKPGFQVFFGKFVGDFSKYYNREMNKIKIELIKKHGKLKDIPIEEIRKKSEDVLLNFRQYGTQVLKGLYKTPGDYVGLAMRVMTNKLKGFYGAVKAFKLEEKAKKEVETKKTDIIKHLANFQDKMMGTAKTLSDVNKEILVNSQSAYTETLIPQYKKLNKIIKKYAKDIKTASKSEINTLQKEFKTEITKTLTGRGSFGDEYGKALLSQLKAISGKNVVNVKNIRKIMGDIANNITVAIAKANKIFEGIRTFTAYLAKAMGKYQSDIDKAIAQEAGIPYEYMISLINMSNDEVDKYIKRQMLPFKKILEAMKLAKDKTVGAFIDEQIEELKKMGDKATAKQLIKMKINMSSDALGKKISGLAVANFESAFKTLEDLKLISFKKKIEDAAKNIKTADEVMDDVFGVSGIGKVTLAIKEMKKTWAERVKKLNDEIVKEEKRHAVLIGLRKRIEDKRLKRVKELEEQIKTAKEKGLTGEAIGLGVAKSKVDTEAKEKTDLLNVQIKESIDKQKDLNDAKKSGVKRFKDYAKAINGVVQQITKYTGMAFTLLEDLAKITDVEGTAEKILAVMDATSKMAKGFGEYGQIVGAVIDIVGGLFKTFGHLGLDSYDELYSMEERQQKKLNRLINYRQKQLKTILDLQKKGYSITKNNIKLLKNQLEYLSDSHSEYANMSDLELKKQKNAIEMEKEKIQMQKEAQEYRIEQATIFEKIVRMFSDKEQDKLDKINADLDKMTQKDEAINNLLEARQALYKEQLNLIRGINDLFRFQEEISVKGINDYVNFVRDKVTGLGDDISEAIDFSALDISLSDIVSEGPGAVWDKVMSMYKTQFVDPQTEEIGETGKMLIKRMIANIAAGHVLVGSKEEKWYKSRLVEFHTYSDEYISELGRLILSSKDQYLIEAQPHEFEKVIRALMGRGWTGDLASLVETEFERLDMPLLTDIIGANTEDQERVFELLGITWVNGWSELASVYQSGVAELEDIEKTHADNLIDMRRLQIQMLIDEREAIFSGEGKDDYYVVGIINDAGWDQIKKLFVDVANMEKEIWDLEQSNETRKFEHVVNMGKYKDKELDKLKDELAMTNELIELGESYVDQDILTQDDLWELLEKRYELEQAITEEKEKQLEKDKKIADTELLRLHRKRRELLLEMRKTGGMGDVISQAQITAFNEAIENRMREIGFSEADITKEMNALKMATLPHFQYGTKKPLSDDTAGYLHKGEMILNKEIIKDWMSIFGKNKAMEYLNQPVKMTEDLNRLDSLLPEYIQHYRTNNYLQKVIKVFNTKYNISLNLQPKYIIENGNPAEIIKEVEKYNKKNMGDMLETALNEIGMTRYELK